MQCVFGNHADSPTFVLAKVSLQWNFLNFSEIIVCDGEYCKLMVLPNIRAIVDVTEVIKSIYYGCLQNSNDQVINESCNSVMCSISYCLCLFKAWRVRVEQGEQVLWVV